MLRAQSRQERTDRGDRLQALPARRHGSCGAATVGHRIPWYSNTMAIRGDLVVVANWRDPKVEIIDLATGRLRRRAAPEMTTVLDGPEDPLLVGGRDEVSSRSTPPGELATSVRHPRRPSMPRYHRIDGPRGSRSACARSFRHHSDPGAGSASFRSGPARPHVSCAGTRWMGRNRRAGINCRWPFSESWPGTKRWLVGEHQLLSVPLRAGLHPARVWSHRTDRPSWQLLPMPVSSLRCGAALRPR
jgi:hypothetical protein